ncbi:MAG TPA: DUF2203 domain-containing protein [Solirubrobacteraceae bacterium]|jgi:hypothetical protein
MLHEHHYTLDQATAVRGWVADRIGSIRRSQAELVALGAHARAGIESLDPQTGGSYPGREVATALVAVSRALNELEAVDVVVRDVERGLVDFPALRGGEEIYLCWLVDEDEIGFWHEPDAGFAGRQPL